MREQNSFFLWLVLLTAALGGCAGKTTSDGMPAPVVGERHTVLLLEDSLARDIEIEDQTLTRGEDGVILAETLIRNRSERTLALSVRCLFKDQLGVTRETSPWKTVTVSPGERSIYVAPSLNRYATRFIAQIRNLPQ